MKWKLEYEKCFILLTVKLQIKQKQISQNYDVYFFQLFTNSFSSWSLYQVLVLPLHLHSFKHFISLWHFYLKEFHHSSMKLIIIPMDGQQFLWCVITYISWRTNWMKSTKLKMIRFHSFLMFLALTLTNKWE